MVHRALVFQLYRTKQLRHVHAKIDLAAEIYNHLIAIQKRYYRRFKGYIGYYRLKRQVTKLKGLARFAHWQQLNAQAIQNIVWRIDQGYQKFFRKENKRLPTFRKRSRYHSITLAQTGWRYEGNNRAAPRPIDGTGMPQPIFIRKGRLAVSKVAVRPPRWLRPLEDRIPRALAVGVRKPDPATPSAAVPEALAGPRAVLPAPRRYRSPAR